MIWAACCRRSRDARGGRADPGGLDDPATGRQEPAVVVRSHRRTQDQGTDPVHPAGGIAEQGQDPRTLPERDFPGSEQLWRGRCRADLFQQDPVATDLWRGRLSGRSAEKARRSAPGASAQGRRGPTQLRFERDVAKRLYYRGHLPVGTRIAVENGAKRRLCPVPRRAAAARLFHRRDPPPTVEILWRRGIFRRWSGDPGHDQSRHAIGGGAGAASRAGKL